MRVCCAHKEKSVLSLVDRFDPGAEYDFCPECMEVFQLLVSGEFFVDAGEEEIRKRGRPKKSA